MRTSKFPVHIQTQRCIPISLPCLASEGYSNIKQSIKKCSNPYQDKEWFPCITFYDEAPDSNSGLGTPALRADHLVCSLYVCSAKTSRKRSEWSECSGMWLNETEGLQSRINSRINCFLDSFYCCTFLSFVDWSRKGQNRNVPLSSGKLPVLSSLLGKMPTPYSCCIFLTLAHSLGIWGGVKTNACPAQDSTLCIFFMHWQKNK